MRGRQQVLILFLLLAIGGYLIVCLGFRNLTTATDGYDAVLVLGGMRRQLLLYSLVLCGLSVLGTWWAVRRKRFSAASGFRVAMVFSVLLLSAVLLIFWVLL